MFVSLSHTLSLSCSQALRALISAVRTNPELIGFNARALAVMATAAAAPGGAEARRVCVRVS